MTNDNTESDVRIFFALWPNKVEQAALAAWQPVLKNICKGRVTREINLHATLVFLGNIEVARVEAAMAAAMLIEIRAFELGWSQLRYWGHNHIVHAAPAKMPEQLSQLVQQLQENLLQQGFRFDQRKFQAHVTLIRNARCGNTPLPVVAPVIWQIRDFALMQSVNTKEGTRYEVLAHFTLRQMLS